MTRWLCRGYTRGELDATRPDREIARCEAELRAGYPDVHGAGTGSRRAGSAEGGVTFGSLFAGIGGMDLGLERAGMQCRWQVEIDPFCRKVLAKHWPSVPKYGDIRELTGTELERVDVIAGGFPCQDVSHAGKREGITGARSGLWSHFARLICVLRPRFVLVENVTGLLDRGMGRVLGDLAELGFDAEWTVLSACRFGASHPRERVFILAYPEGVGSGQLRRLECTKESAPKRYVHWASTEPPCERVAHGVPDRAHRLTALGNAVVPQVAEWIGRRIIEADRAKAGAA